jgi:hypothetical protein
MCVIIFITYSESNEEKKKKKTGGDFCAPSNDGNGNRGTIFIFSNKSTPSMSFSSRVFFSYVYIRALSVSLSRYSTTIIDTIMIIHLTNERCFLRSTYKNVLHDKDIYKNAEAFEEKKRRKKNE